jgi:8-oxo-dGTP diphosphatase
MKFRKVALLLPYNENLEILFQNRRKVMKQYTKDYGFFGGKIEEGETKEQALAREMMEELEIDVNELENLEFFKRFDLESEELGLKAELNLFLCKLPEIDENKCHEGKPVIIKLSEAFNLNISPWDKQMLTEIQEYLKSK